MATDQILTIQAAVAASGIPVKTAGPVVVVRPISGTNRPSQHSFGNAMDYYPSTSDEAAKAKRGERVPSLEALYDFLVRNKGSLPIAVVCYYGRGGCTTSHPDHVHVDGKPHVSSVQTGGKAQEPGGIMGYVDDIQGAFDATLEGTPGGIQDIDVPVISTVGELIQLVGTGELWVRVGFVVGGFLAVGAGVYFIAKEFGAPSVTSIAGTAVGSKIPG